MSVIQLLVTDLDGTLLGDAASLARFHAWRESEGAAVTLAYATGRTCADVSRLVAGGALPRPDFTIGALGTELFEQTSNSLATIGPLFGSTHWDTSTVRSVLARFPKARLQPDEFQSQYKSSYFLADAQPDELAAIYKALTQARLDFEALYSGARFLDVLPQGVSKGSTARMLAKKLGVAISQVIACGDSGNDVTLFAQGFRGVIVANAEEALASIVPAETYRSPLTHADGVLDGFRYWFENGQPHPAESLEHYS